MYFTFQLFQTLFFCPICCIYDYSFSIPLFIHSILNFFPCRKYKSFNIIDSFFYSFFMLYCVFTFYLYINNICIIFFGYSIPFITC